MTTIDLPEHASLEQMLRAMVEGFEKLDPVNGHRMMPIERFVLECGTVFKPAKRPKGMRKMRDKLCFSNAVHTVMRSNGRLRYAEGMAWHIIPTVHAWCVTEDGVVVDPTWSNPEARQYMGVVFDEDEVWRELYKNRVYGLLDPGMVNLELMDRVRARMKGEKT